MKKILAALAAVSVMAMPFAALAEEEVQAPVINHFQSSVTNLQVTVNDTVFDFTGLEADSFLTRNSDGTVSESGAFYVNGQYACGYDSLLAESLFTLALQAVDGVYLSPAFTLDLNKITEQAQAMMTQGAEGSADLNAFIESISKKLTAAFGIAVANIAQLTPEESTLTGVEFADGQTCDLSMVTYNVDSETLKTIAAQVFEVIEEEAPEGLFENTSVRFGVGTSESGRALYAVSLTNADTVYELDVQVITDNGLVVFAVADVNDMPIAQLTVSVALVENTLNAMASVQVPSYYEDVSLSGEIDPQLLTFTGSATSNVVQEQMSASSSFDVYVAAMELDSEGANEAFLSLDKVDFMALSEDSEAVQQLLPAFMENGLNDSLALLAQVPGVAMIMQMLTPPAETTEAVTE